MTKQKADTLAVWGRFALEVGIIIVAIAMAFGGLDKRLAVIEAQVKASIDAQKDWATKSQLEDVKQRLDKLEQGGYRGR